MIDWKWLLRTRFLRGHGRIYKPFYERHVRAILRTIKGDAFWDVGANIGFYTLLAQRNFRRIVAVEPNPETAAILRKRVARAANVEVLELALSNASGQTPLYTQKEKFNIPGFNNKYGSDSILSKVVCRSARDPSNDRVIQNRPSIRVTQSTFDEVSMGPVDLVKIDVNGAEFLVLEGMRRSLKDGLVKRIMIELHNLDDTPRLESMLANYGYTINWVDPDHPLAISG